MVGRLLRLLLRIAGWLLTPLVLILAAAIGATIGLLVAPTFSTATTGFIAVGVLALLAAIAGLFGWVHLLREHPELRHTLEMSTDGTPVSPLVQRLIHPDAPPPADAP